MCLLGAVDAVCCWMIKTIYMVQFSACGLWSIDTDNEIVGILRDFGTPLSEDCRRKVWMNHEHLRR